MSVWHPAPLAAARGRTTGVNKMNIAAIQRRWNVDKQLSSVKGGGRHDVGYVPPYEEQLGHGY